MDVDVSLGVDGDGDGDGRAQRTASSAWRTPCEKLLPGRTALPQERLTQRTTSSTAAHFHRGAPCDREMPCAVRFRSSAGHLGDVAERTRAARREVGRAASRAREERSAYLRRNGYELDGTTVDIQLLKLSMPPNRTLGQSCVRRRRRRRRRRRQRPRRRSRCERGC